MTSIKPKVVVVDDEPAIGELLTRFLIKKNYQVTTFTSAKEALKHLKNNYVNLLLTDLSMSEMDGIQLIKATKGFNPGLPIVVMSGSVDGEERDEIFSLGADFIHKPFELVDLLKRIGLQITHLNKVDKVISK